MFPCTLYQPGRKSFSVFFCFVLYKTVDCGGEKTYTSNVSPNLSCTTWKNTSKLSDSAPQLLSNLLQLLQPVILEGLRVSSPPLTPDCRPFGGGGRSQIFLCDRPHPPSSATPPSPNTFKTHLKIHLTHHWPPASI